MQVRGLAIILAGLIFIAGALMYEPNGRQMSVTFGAGLALVVVGLVMTGIRRS